jgi:hypothetical protein
MPPQAPSSSHQHEYVAGGENKGQRQKFPDKSFVGHGLVPPWETVVRVYCLIIEQNKNIECSNMQPFSSTFRYPLNLTKRFDQAGDYS